MGVRNATVKRLKVADLTTTVLTMTLTGLAADSPLGGGNGEGSSRRTAAVLAMLIGAIAGALLASMVVVAAAPVVAAWRPLWTAVWFASRQGFSSLKSLRGILLRKRRRGKA